MNKWLVLVAVALLLAWGPFLYAELTSEPVEKKARDLPTERARDDEPVELIEVEEANEEPEQETAEAVAAPAPDEAEPPQEELEAEMQQLEQDEAEPAAAPQQEPLPGSEDGEDETQQEPAATAPPASGPTAVLKQSYDSEPRDALWASSAEQRIAALFAGDDMPEDMFQRASCRQAVCQLELHWSPEHVEAYASVQKTISEQFGSQIGVEPSGAVSEEGVQPLLLYVLREGYSLQDLQN